jgi:hypothetical protein
MSKETSKPTPKRVGLLRKWKLLGKHAEMVEGQAKFKNSKDMIKIILDANEARPKPFDKNEHPDLDDAIHNVTWQINELCTYLKLAPRGTADETAERMGNCVGWDADPHFPLVCMLVGDDNRSNDDVRAFAINLSHEVWRLKLIRDAWIKGITKRNNPAEYNELTSV